MNIHCPKCGSKNLKVQKYLLFGEDGTDFKKFVCQDCSYQSISYQSIYAPSKTQKPERPNVVDHLEYLAKAELRNKVWDRFEVIDLTTEVNYDG